ncbi:MAG: hypothetical protein A2612_00170 [Candidatus Moranbacteria bacterium RIFOXYD1_FULL_44_12]|nr:MAG: hypothetical protein A2612_00170 [Candidatus Moranbacteria bacterium RIFOXYD1_FULL_44_12]
MESPACPGNQKRIIDCFLISRQKIGEFFPSVFLWNFSCKNDVIADRQNPGRRIFHKRKIQGRTDMVRYAKGRKRDWTKVDPRIVEEILLDLITQPDIMTAEECGSACLQLNFQRTQFRIDRLPLSIARKIPALVSKIHELSQVPF